jgi:aspartyl-tRNA(Asn)/glutamyl-tRNA(Gln) amidotransferase subunit B
MLTTGRDAVVIVEEKGLKQESDAGAIGALCAEVLAANPQSVDDFKAGKAAALNFLKGQVMKLSKGKANPVMVGDLLAQKLS